MIVWQKAMNLASEVYMLAKLLPREELFALYDQMRRAAVSIPSNIAEGQARGTSKEFAYFLSVSQGSKAELETQLLLCIRLGYFTQAQADKALSLCQEVGKILTVLISKLTTNN